MAFLAPIHAQIVHVPIVLLLTGFLLEIAGRLLDREWLRKAAGLMLALGVAGAVAAVLTGRDDADHARDQGVSDLALSDHEVMGTMTLGYALGALVLRVLAPRTRFRRWLAAASLLAWLIACVFLVIAADCGGDLVYRHGAAVRAGASRPP